VTSRSPESPWSRCCQAPFSVDVPLTLGYRGELSLVTSSRIQSGLDMRAPVISITSHTERASYDRILLDRFVGDCQRCG
jgi:hypothetical protein